MATYEHVFQYPFARLNVEPFPLKGKWREEFFKNDNPIILELGCGKGEYTLGMGMSDSTKNFIGIDVKGARMWSGATKSKNLGLDNVAFIRTEIEMIEQFFSYGEVSEIWITFCDPQMKKATKRLTSSFFLCRYSNILAQEGLIHLKTDSPFLYTYTKALIDLNNLPIEYITNDLYNEKNKPEPASSIQTYYEEQWLSRGLTIKYIVFSPFISERKQYQEPEIEIEYDSYRSFGRNKRQ